MADCSLSGRKPPLWSACVLSLLFYAAGPAFAGDGHFLQGIGPLNSSIGGAGTALFLDPLGMMAWNPAGAVTFEKTRLYVALELFSPAVGVSSQVDRGAFAPGFPPFTLSGDTASPVPVIPLGGLGLVYRPPGSRTAFFLGGIGLTGFVADYAEQSFAADSNPIVTPQAPKGIGFGAIQSDYRQGKIVLGAARQITDRVSMGGSLVLGLALLKISPVPFVPPDDANGDGFPSYPRASARDLSPGIGFQLGVLYRATDGLSLGVSYASRIWNDQFEFASQDEIGQPRRLAFSLDVPDLVTAGFAYKVAPKTVLAADARWIHYRGTNGFVGGFEANGALTGVGWDNIWAVGGGLQHVAGKNGFRIGYHFSQSPIPTSQVQISTAVPALAKHHFGGGYSRTLSPALTLDLSFWTALDAEQTGPYLLPTGAVPGTRVSNRIHANDFSIGLSWAF